MRCCDARALRLAGCREVENENENERKNESENESENENENESTNENQNENEGEHEVTGLTRPRAVPRNTRLARVISVISTDQRAIARGGRLTATTRPWDA